MEEAIAISKIYTDNLANHTTASLFSLGYPGFSLHILLPGDWI